MDLCFTRRVCRLGFTIDICGYDNWAAMSQETCEGRGVVSGRMIGLNHRQLFVCDTMNVSKKEVSHLLYIIQDGLKLSLFSQPLHLPDLDVRVRWI